jgi:phytoene synthase
LNPQDGSLRKKTSFYLPLLLLEKKERQAMESFYRFCWAADEISDGQAPLMEKKRRLALFKKMLGETLAGKPPNLLFASLGKTIQDFDLSPEPLRRILQGVERDLRPLRFKTFTELRSYALQVAGGPGLASMEIFGFKDKPHRDYAGNLGIFLQIVNMVRDVQEDWGLHRQYLPLEDFKRFHLDPARLEEKNSQWPFFVAFQLDRAWFYLEKSRGSLSFRQRSELPTAEAIAAVYVKLFQKLKNNPRAILRGRVSLSTADKSLSLLGAAGRCWYWKGRAD